jgi:hypothetical protein
MTPAEQTDAAYAYLRSIRNPAKHKYAHALILRKLAPDQYPLPSRGALSVMGGQAVEMRLAEIFRAD